MPTLPELLNLLVKHAVNYVMNVMFTNGYAVVSVTFTSGNIYTVTFTAGVVTSVYISRNLEF